MSIHEFWSVLGWPIIFTAASFAAYYVYIKPTLAKIATTMGKPETVAASSGAAKISALAENWKTLALSGLGSLVLIIKTVLDTLDADMLAELKTLPWASAFTDATANKILLAITFLIPLTHLSGKLKAAATPPKA